MEFSRHFAVVKIYFLNKKKTYYLIFYRIYLNKKIFFFIRDEIIYNIIKYLSSHKLIEIYRN